MMVTRLTLIRHGLTQWNKLGRYCGRKDVVLNKEGRRQAQCLAKQLKATRFDKVYSSDRKRSLQTARIVFKKAKIIRVSSLRELDFGVLEGLRHNEIMKKYPSVYRRWLNDPYRDCIPGAEPMRVFKRRVKLGIEKIIRLNAGKDLAIVCHGGVIGIFISSILKKKNFWRYIPKTASLTIVEHTRGIFKVKERNG
ncbi:MAG: histidine phosphatase family protein [Candidatus Omnitrophota bacterium]